MVVAQEHMTKLGRFGHKTTPYFSGTRTPEVALRNWLKDLINNNIQKGRPNDLVSSWGRLASDYEKRPKIRAKDVS